MTVDMLPPDDSACQLSFSDKVRGVVGFVVGYMLIHCMPPLALEGTLKLLRRIMRPALKEATERHIQSVRWASRGYLGRAACLEVSLGACCASMLTWRMPTWCVGTRFRPVEQHAWLEVDGVPVSEPEADDWPHRPLIRI
jgi:hypothetical protein